MSYETIIVQREGGVAHVLLNRPLSRNTMSLAMVDELIAALAALEGEADMRAVVIRGIDHNLCAGGDLKDMASARGKALSGGDPEALVKLNRRIGELYAAYAVSPLAIVAVAEGAVMSAGFGLVCVADVVLTEANAHFQLAESSIGLVPAQIIPRLRERLGGMQARRLIVTGAAIDGHTAWHIGLAHECCADTDALDAALAHTLHDILQCAPQALAQSKALLRQARLTSSADMIEIGAAAFSAAAISPEGKEGMTALVQKRKASWMP